MEVYCNFCFKKPKKAPKRGLSGGLFELGSSGSLIKSGGLYELIQYVFFSQYQTIWAQWAFFHFFKKYSLIIRGLANEVILVYAYVKALITSQL